MRQQQTKAKSFAAAAAASVVLGLAAGPATALAAPASTDERAAVSARKGDTRKCVTRGERKKIKKGMSRKRANRILDGKGTLNRMVGPAIMYRNYPACPSGPSSFAISYSKATGTWRVHEAYFAV